MRTQRKRRTGFTIVEMMVSMALILFIMAVIAQVFSSASKTYTALRVAGQLQERGRSAAGVIRKDLTVEHFDGPFVSGRSGPRVGDQRLDLSGWTPPPKGYWEITQGSAATFEPISAPSTDGEGLTSTRATNHALRFTAHLPDVPAAELYCVQVPAYPLNPNLERIDSDRRVNSFPISAGVVYSRWAEIHYFLVANGEVTPATAAGPSLPLFSLRRRVRVLAPVGVSYDNVDPTLATNTVSQFQELAMIAIPSTNFPGKALLRVLGPDDVTNPIYRMSYLQPTRDLTGAETGTDILITDVLSFEVKAAWLFNQSLPSFNSQSPNSSPAPGTIFANGNSDEPYDNIPFCTLNTDPKYFGQRVFDTWYRATASDTIDWDKPSAELNNFGFLAPRAYQVPMRINVRALQIKIRVWDAKAEQARQMTIAQEI